MNILIVEDDPTIVFALKRALEKEQYSVSAAFTVQEAERLISSVFDLYILDIGLPDGSGYTVAQAIRHESDTPIIFLSARDDELAINQGFDLGGDDYITKPFRISELKRRIESILKRSKARFINQGVLSIDLNSATVRVSESLVDLSVLEYRLLLILVDRANTLITRQTLNELLWDDAEFISSNALSVNIKRLRHKLGNKVSIETLHGKGYRLNL